MHHTTIIATLAAALLAAGADIPARAQQFGVAVTGMESPTATVGAVNLGSGEVILGDEGGRLLTAVVGPEARSSSTLRARHRPSGRMWATS